MNTIGPFGGDLTKAHFTVHPVYRLPHEDNAMARARNKEERAKLKTLKWKTPYFTFTVGNDIAKSNCRILALAFAAKWEKKSGIKMEIGEGCFL